MGKASRARSARQAVAEIKREQEMNLRLQKKKKRMVNIIVAAVCVVLCVVFAGSLFFINSAQNSGYFLRRKVAMKSDNLEVNGATFAYFFNYQYQDFVNTYAQNLASYGLNVEMPLREQETSDGQNWFDYMVGLTETNLKEVLYLAEKATAEGMKLDESYHKQIDDIFADIKAQAEQSKVSEEEYIHVLYGQGVSKEDIRKGLELSMLATQYYTKVIDSRTYTDDEINEYFQDNSVDFLTVDYKYYNFTPNVTEDMTAEQAQTEYDKVKAYAERLSKATSPESFDRILTDILKERGTTDTNIQTAIEDSVLVGNVYDEDFEISTWAFSSDAKLNSTKIYTNGNNRGVYMLTKLAYRDEGETRSVRHILISSNSYETDEQAKKKAEEVLAEYNKGEKTAESFGKLAKKYSEDPGSVNTGGLYEQFSKGTMVEEFENWSFDKQRKQGDTGIVKTNHGYHIMYFEEVGEPVWKGEVILSLKDSAYNALFNELKETYKVELIEETLDSVPVIVIKNSSSTAA